MIGVGIVWWRLYRNEGVRILSLVALYGAIALVIHYHHQSFVFSDPLGLFIYNTILKPNGFGASGIASSAIGKTNSERLKTSTTSIFL